MIELNIIFYPFILLIIILVLHILIWRIRKPQKHIISLFLLFNIIPGFLILIIFLIFNELRIYLLSIEDILLIFLLYTALSGVYIQTFPSIQAGSPSLLIVNLIGRNIKPVNAKTISKSIRKENFINDRVSDLKKENLIIINDNSVMLTRRGKILSGIFILYRKFIGLKEGEG